MIRDGTDGSTSPERRGQIIRLAAIAVVVLAVLLVVLDNRRSVRIGWVFGDTDVSLIVVILLSFAAGALVGTLGAWQRRRRR